MSNLTTFRGPVTDGLYDELKDDFEQVKEINELRLTPMLHQWMTQELCDILLNKIGFSRIILQSDEIYAGQSMFICAEK